MPGATYALQLDATLEDGGAAGAASVTFYVAKPPSAGRVFATPGAGYALDEGEARLQSPASSCHRMLAWVHKRERMAC